MGVEDGGDGWKGPQSHCFWLGGPLCWVARALRATGEQAWVDGLVERKGDPRMDGNKTELLGSATSQAHV